MAADPSELAQMLETVAKHKEVIEAPISTWLRLLRDQPEYGFLIADRPETPSEVLICVALVGDRRTRFRLVLRNTLPAAAVELLESDPEVGAATHQVYAPHVDREKLERLANHRWPLVRAAADARLAALEEPESDG